MIFRLAELLPKNRSTVCQMLAVSAQSSQSLTGVALFRTPARYR